MDLWEIIGTTVSFGTASPTIFSQALVFPPVNILQKNFVEGRHDCTSRFGHITKNLQNCFPKCCLLTKCNDENKF
jgi:hypothetical protein